MTTKIRLLTATTLAAVSGAAYAQTPAPTLPTAELRGAGATAIGPATAILMNCIGNPGTTVANTEPGGRGGPVTALTGAGATVNSQYWYYGTNSNQALFQVPGVYLPLTPATTNPQLNCLTQTVQPNFQGKYIGTGSGGGRNWWASFRNQTPATNASNINPFTRTGANNEVQGTQWSNVQFAFSEGPISASDVTCYNANAANSTNNAGAAIQVPFYVVPVALAYPSAYGLLTDGAEVRRLAFNVKTPVRVGSTAAGFTTIGGLRLNRSIYCRIFNGVITNWNHPDIQRLNGGNATTNPGQALFDPVFDTATRWSNEGVAIRLVGRLDSSGTTNIFVRHLAAVCPAEATTGGYTNKFTRPEADSLPFSSSTIDLRSFLSGTRYFATNTSTSLAGTVNAISGAVYERTTNTIVTTQGQEAAGLFMVADGNSGVEAAIRNEDAANLRTSTVNANLRLNGKFGYTSTDWTVPAPGRSNLVAALPVGTSTTSYAAATVANGLKAFGTILPPQATTNNGAFDTSDTRQGFNGTVSRANPRDWAAVLYPPAGNGVTGLAIPTGGYAITGVSFALLYTCYNSTAKRLAVVNAFATGLGKQTKVAVARTISPTSTTTSVSLSGNTFKGTGATAVGIITQFGLGIVPGAWTNAIFETFLRRSAQVSNGVALSQLSANATLNGTVNGGLWIQSALPTSALQFNGTTGRGDPADVTANPSCVAGQGA